MIPNDWMNPEYVPGLVSVIIPTYNRAHLITRALDSVRNQTYRPIELIVVDDGSEDDTESVVTGWVREHQANDLIVQYVRQPNRGAPSARNHGLIKSSGEFIQFLDSDDLLTKDKISLHVEALQFDFSADYIWSNAIKTSRAESGLSNAISADRNHEPSPQTMPVKHRHKIVPYVVCGLLRRSACADLGPWNEDLQGDQDWEYGIRFIASGMNALYLPAPLYVIVTGHGARIADSRDANANSVIAACRAAESKLIDGLPGKASARYCIAQKYIQGNLISMLTSDTLNSIETMRGAIRNSRGHRKLSAKLMLLRLSYIIFGGHTTCKLYELARCHKFR